MTQNMSNKPVINTIANRLTTAHENIEQTRQKLRKSETKVNLMAVSKTKPISDVVEAYNAGQRIFGENYAQELADKSSELHHLTDIEWHYIGPIQSNKTKIIAESATWVDSIDRAKIAKRLQQHASELNKTLNVLIQVNISRSDKKSGVLLEDVEPLAAEIANCQQLTLRGLMAIPDKSDESQLRQEFLQMQTCFQTLKQQYPMVDTLSLGMSGDMEIAIECGSTMVRLGTALFGERTTK